MNQIDQIIATLIKLEADAAQQGFYSADFVSVATALQVMKLDTGWDYPTESERALIDAQQIAVEKGLSKFSDRRAAGLLNNLCGDPV